MNELTVPDNLTRSSPTGTRYSKLDVWEWTSKAKRHSFTSLMGSLIPMFVFVILAMGLNIVVGYAGLLDIGYVAFFVIGAYGMAFLTSPNSYFIQKGWVPEFLQYFWPAMLVSWVIAAISGVIIGAPTLRLRGDYLAIVTLGFGEIVPDFFTNAEGLTRGPRGIGQIAAPANWDAIYRNHLAKSESDEVRQVAQLLALQFGDQAVRAELMRLVGDESAALERRREALTALTEIRASDLPAKLHDLLSGSELRRDALVTLAEFGNDQTPAAVIGAYSTLDLAEKRIAIDVLSSSPAAARQLLEVTPWQDSSPFSSSSERSASSSSE